VGITNKPVLDTLNGQELALEILSFSGGENTVSEDQAMKISEARVLENWDAISIGGMERSKGFNEVADGGASYSAAPDLLIQHKDSGGTAVYGIIAGDLVIKDGSSINQENAAAFSSGVLSHAVSAGDALWITNATDNLKRKTVGNVIAAATGQPATACARIYNSKNRLLAEGSTSVPKRVYGSRTGTGNWNNANTWSLANDAFSIDLPEDTSGMAPNFPSGNEDLVFTADKAYALSNYPNASYRPIPNSRGCAAPLSIARGDEGVYFVSRRPTLGVFLFDGVNFKELSQFNKDVFVDKINFSGKIFGFYRDSKYYLIYNETGSGVTYPNRIRIFDARFGRWMSRPINSALADNMGYPALLKYSSNEIYIASSRKDKIYEFETTDNSDEGQETLASYKTKTVSSRDFALASGGQFPIDDVRMKLEKITITYYGVAGALGILWSADRGLHSGSKTIDLTAAGDLINTTFTVNSSKVITTPQDKTRTYSFPNHAVGRRFDFTFTNNGTGARPKIKKIKIHAIALDES